MYDYWLTIRIYKKLKEIKNPKLYDTYNILSVVILYAAMWTSILNQATSIMRMVCFYLGSYYLEAGIEHRWFFLMCFTADKL